LALVLEVSVSDHLGCLGLVACSTLGWLFVCRKMFISYRPARKKRERKGVESQYLPRAHS
jgi:hypothetical protein